MRLRALFARLVSRRLPACPAQDTGDRIATYAESSSDLTDAAALRAQGKYLRHHDVGGTSIPALFFNLVNSVEKVAEGVISIDRSLHRD